MNITLDDGRTELWQWDTGRKIVVDDKSVSEVHYSKYSSTQAITREVIDGKAEIPNFLLQDTHEVTVYAYSGSIENGYTVAEKTFNVVKKPKPANYVETEEDKAILAKLKAAIGDLSELQTEAKDSLVSAINEAAASGGADWSQNDPDGDGYVKNRPGGYMSDPAYNEVFNGALGGEALEVPCIFTSGDIVKVTIDGEEKDYTVVEEEVEGTTIYRVGTDPYINVLTGAVANGFAIATFTMDGVNAIISAAYGTYVGKTVIVKANVAMPVVIPAKFLPPKESDVIAIRLEKTGHDYARCSRSDYHKLHDAIDNGKEIILILSGGIDPANGWYRYSENTDDGMHFVRITDYGGCYMHTLVNTEINDNFAVFKVVESRTFVTTNDNPGSADEDGKMLVVKNGEWAKSDGKSITLKSSTEGSTKKFKLTIDDTGTLTASEITA